MTVGGTGDILAGICTGMLAIKRYDDDLFKTAEMAVKLNGSIGDILKKKAGFGFISSDFLLMIPLLIITRVNEKLAS